MSKNTDSDVLLEGWIKKKSTDSGLFKSNNNRWFRLQNVKGSDGNELALCYYANQKESQAKGWIYLKDVVEVRDDRKTFTIVSSARTLLLEAVTAAEHNIWVSEMRRCSPQLRPNDSAKLSTRSDVPQAKVVVDPMPASESLKADVSKKDAGIDRMFSRHAMGEKSSFYANGAKAQSDASFAPMGSLDENYREEDLDLQPDLARSQDSLGLEGQQQQRGDSRDRQRAPDSREGHRPSHNNQSDSSNQPVDRPRGNSHHDRESDSRERRRFAGEEDHRKTAHQHGSSTTSRLHKFIARDSASGSGVNSGVNSRTSSRGRAERADDEDSEIEDVAQRSAGMNRIRERHSNINRRREREEEEQRDRSASSSDAEDGKENEEGRRTAQTAAPVATAAASAPVARKAAPPPPKMAPPRRAKDALIEAEQQQQHQVRRSIDEVLFRRNEADVMRAEDKAPSDEEDAVDFKAEFRQRHYNASDTKDSPDSGRPPKHNAASSSSSRAMPMPQSAPPTQLLMNRGNAANRAGTPPRPQGNAGPSADRDFVTENWDADDLDNHKAESKKAESKKDPTMLAADPNWLDENFDED